MKKATIVIVLLLIYAGAVGQGATTISGSVTSLNDTALPKAHILIEPWNRDLLFNSQKVEVQDNGNFIFKLRQSGLYRILVRGVLHKSIQFPLWVREPDSLNVSIRMDPKNLDDGTYFERDEYISWIRVTGNFNGYNYDTGVRFQRIAPKTLRAKITTSLDTVRYQIVGITSGTAVLPDAYDYELRDRSNYEAIVPVRDDAVVLTYKADSTYYPNKNPYEGYRTTWDPDQTKLEFSNPVENKIHKNLDAVNYFPRLFNYEVFDSDSLRMDQFQSYMALINKKRSNLYIKELRNTEEQLKNYRESDTRYHLISLYYKYLYLSQRITGANNQSVKILKKDPDLIKYINREVIRASMQHLPPSSPLWSLRKQLIKSYSQILGYSQRVISYLEQVVLENPDNNITGNLLLDLFKWSYDMEGNSDRTKKYYQQILNQFGDRYYARKAREYVQENE